MHIRFFCKNCGRKLKADPEAAGQRSECPECGNELVIPTSSTIPDPSVPPSEVPPQEPVSTDLLDSAKGKYTCPTCWLKFDPGAIMHISVHESLKGDPILGEDAQQRFFAMRFNEKRQALDAMGMICTEIACPHCRRRLPIGFVDEPQHIISLVGDQSAGKSYFLAVLSKILPGTLFNHFRIVMQDADPTGNAALNDLRKSLFAAVTPEQVRVNKTVMEGAMYERLPRQGRIVALPRPFVYTMGAANHSKARSSLIFYDNAGEHFQPGVRLTEQPGALHVASASAILFLFDPFNNPDFRRAMQGTADPQMEKPVLDQQDIILSEMRSRILKIRGLPSNHCLSEPLAVMVGKYDAWSNLLPGEALEYPVVNGEVNLEAIRRNSLRVRQMLLRICPSIVANGEALSDDVCYFAVSAFGHTPVKVGEGTYAPDPARLKPFQCDVPLLWALTKLCPTLVPTSAEKSLP
jgi:DNA-directed RNA polymerase subunit RPC12/RpoP